MNRWLITFTDGSSEETPEFADMLGVDVDGSLLRARRSSRTYGVDETVAVYVLANVRKWEPIQ